ncbi:MAG: glycerol-3-phosphate acyltransferase [Caldilineaceae bacterium]|nr:glycerol-3-phosphate acyltransferase [Caldilineaceae bacterium]MBP8107265.1 glycerol-3-phosphate acyltransferase [Caldilineaceae bacterium]MBP8122370.1 glycerol-3-phosphate acyltransferase [Caldilineaceae bacterium]MBP9071079.1 glycerol-3-phosphate acyltransferase [Caldilineaceae bacterium]
MMTGLIVVVAAGLVGYLLGSLPIGYLVCRLYGVDIRTVGSGRTGGTNAWRAAGLKAAIPTILGDAGKGALAILLVNYAVDLWFPSMGSLTKELAAALAGGAAVWGHNWSIFLKFKGGAGGITAAVTCLALFPLAGGMVALVGALVIWWTRMASVGTFAVGATAFASLTILALAGDAPGAYILFGIMALAAIFISLRRNRENVRDGKERVITIW